MQNDYDIEKIFEQIENDLISSMKRTLWSHKEDEKTKGFNWPQWQALKLKQLEDFRKNNQDIFKNYNQDIKYATKIQMKKQFREGASRTNKQAIKAGVINKEDSQLSGSFFGLNDRKIKALMKSTTKDINDVKYATLRMANDQYRQIIYKAEVYANTGAKTVQQAIDMATHDFLARGFNCIEYKNGSRHNIADYCDMAIRTANKRANLMGEGEMRKKLGNSLVYISKHGGACDKCSPWQGRVYIDDVWSDGKKEDGKYPLLSTAIAGGLFHPRCEHGSSTYYEGINNEPEEVTQALSNEHEDEYTQALQRQKRQYERLALGSLFPENVLNYQNKVNELQKQINNATISENKELTLEECKQLVEKHNIAFWDNDLSQIDSKLLSENIKRLDELIEEYPKCKEFIKTRKVKFNALNLNGNEMAHVSSDIDLKNIEISLSKKHYKDYKTLLETETNELKIKHCMDRAEQYKSTYTITHEFGHFIESMFIDEYNKQHLAEFLNMKSKALNAKTIAQSKKVISKWEANIADQISQDIYDIALKNNPNIKINEILSEYGKKNSFEFFAECFANLECGKPNELGLALKEYLKKRGL